MAALAINVSAFARFCGSKEALAPEATTIQFSAFLSTVIRATPDGFLGSDKIKLVFIPSSSNPEKKVFVCGVGHPAYRFPFCPSFFGCPG